MRGRDWKRHGKAIYRSKRWRALRWEILRRDGFQCQKCGARTRLEIDHIESIKDAPALSFEGANLQTLCKECHSSKTREETHGALSPAREAWRELILSM